MHVRGLVWRSHTDQAHFSEEENLHLVETVNEAGGEVLLDERVRRDGSHHQKLFVVRHPDAPERDVAFVGGIDLCHGRRDDAAPRRRRAGDRARPALRAAPAVARRPAGGARPGRRRPGVDVPGALGGPDAARPPQPVAQRCLRQVAGEPRHPDPLPPMPADPPPAGRPRRAGRCARTRPSGRAHAVRPRRRAQHRPRLPQGLRAGHAGSCTSRTSTCGRAPRPRSLADRLRDEPRLHLVAVVPRYPDRDGRLSGPPNRIGQQRAIELLREAGGERVAFFDLEAASGWPIYVHAKVCIIDDIWMIVGSDNLNLRSWTNDSELSCAVLDERRDDREPVDPGGHGDGARVLARDTRLRLWREHLGRDDGDDADLVDAVAGIEVLRRAADGRSTPGTSGGRPGPRPPGRLRHHRPGPVRWWAQWWAEPLHRLARRPRRPAPRAASAALLRDPACSAIRSRGRTGVPQPGSGRSQKSRFSRILAALPVRPRR